MRFKPGLHGFQLLILCVCIPFKGLADDSVLNLHVPAGVGSALPNLSRGAGGQIVLSWVEPHGENSQLKFAALGDDGWGPAKTVSEGDQWFVNWADFPSVMPISGSLWAAHWLSKKAGGTYSYDVSVAISTDSGSSWSEPITPHRDNTATEHGFVSLFPMQQGAGVLWLDGRNTASVDGETAHHDDHGSGGMTLRSAVITATGEITAEIEMDRLVCDCCQTGVALARQGPVAVYRNRTESEIRDIYLARYIDDKWQPGEPVHEDGWEISGCPVNGPAIAADGDTVVVAWFTMAGDIPRVRFARSTDGGASFGSPLEIAEHSPGGRVDVALLDNGKAVISWLDETPNGKGAIRLRMIDPDGSVSLAHTIAGTDTSRPTGFPQLVSSGNALVVAWTDAQENATTVRSALISGLIDSDFSTD